MKRKTINFRITILSICVVLSGLNLIAMFFVREKFDIIDTFTNILVLSALVFIRKEYLSL